MILILNGMPGMACLPYISPLYAIYSTAWCSMLQTSLHTHRPSLVSANCMCFVPPPPWLATMHGVTADAILFQDLKETEESRQRKELAIASNEMTRKVCARYSTTVCQI